MTGRPEFTGERFLPWIGDSQLAYEHLHRYYFAATLVADVNVLDVGSGEGFGTAILAETAKTVTGIDVDAEIVGHSAEAYAGENLAFLAGSALDMPFEDRSFDVVTCFEVVEHLEDHGALLEEIKRILRPAGLLVISTPDREAYGARGAEPNPFHVHELGTGEFDDLLGSFFRHHALWGQRVVVGSELWRLTADLGGSGSTTDVTRTRDGWRAAERGAPVYLLGVAWDEHVPNLPATSHLFDSALELVRGFERSAAQAHAELAQAGTELSRLGAQLAAARREGDELRARFEQAHQQLRESESMHRRESETRREVEQLVRDLEARARRDRESLGEANLRATASQSELERVLRSRGWRALEHLRRLRRLPRRGTVAAPPLSDAVESTSEPSAGSDELHSYEVPVTGPSFEPVGSPAASVIIPVHDQLDMALRCLASVAANTDHALAEIIVVDDASSDTTAARLRDVVGIVLIRSDENVGFLKACNLGAESARAPYIVFLNSDTEVQRGWLDALLETARSSPSIGAVGAKLVYPTGLLQEAGATIWSDGTGWNHGRGKRAEAPEHAYPRVVDYCSAACLLVPRALFRKVGGFDVRYAPAYYEDADLCFSLREEGYETVYEPSAVVLHHEGASYGTDERLAVGDEVGKAHQYRNRRVFAEKWKEVLPRQRAPGAGRGVLAGRRDERIRVLFVDWSVPTHDQDAGSLRVRWMLRLLRSIGCDVTFFPVDRVGSEPYTSGLQQDGIEVLHGQDFPTVAEARAGLYDLVVVSRPTVAEVVLGDVVRHFPDATVVYDTVDLHHVREQRKRDLHGIPADASLDHLRSLEVETMRRSDIVAVVTDEEARAVEALVPGARTVVLPTVHDVPDRPLPPFEARADLMFIGGFRHDPNVDAVLHFVHDVLDRVLDEIDVRFWVLGAHPPPSITALQSSRVVVTGYVPDADAYFDRMRVFVSPLRYGAGMKGKNGHALALGLPMVTTSVGAEGLGLVDGTHAFVKDDPQAFAAAVVELYRDASLWKRMSEAGQSLVREQWSPAVMTSRLEALVDLVRASAEPVSERVGAASSG